MSRRHAPVEAAQLQDISINVAIEDSRVTQLGFQCLPCVTLGRLHNLSGAELPPLETVDHDGMYLRGWRVVSVTSHIE